jgi:hypothetical protein
MIRCHVVALWAPCIIAGLAANYFEHQMRRNRIPGVPLRRVITSPGALDPDLYTATGKRFRRRALRFMLLSLALGAIAGLLSWYLP